MTVLRSEEVFQFDNDNALDVPTNVGEGAEDVFASRDSLIAERYVRGDFEIHLHFRLLEPEVADYCVRFEVAAEGDVHSVSNISGSHLERDAGAALAPPEADFAVESPHQAKALVPIYPRQFVEDEKVVALSVVRLQLLDSCSHLRVHRPDFVHAASGVVPAGRVSVGLLEGLPRPADWEPDRPLGGIAGTLGRESPGEMFEGAPHVLEGVPDKDAQKRRRLLNNLRAEDVLASFRLFLMGDSIGFSGAEGGKLVAQNFQVLARPKQLEAGTSE